mmetsp:Transcript_21283/g.26246  ORF Transcript_21283/g.26246 Transcript_21283/m.26246 type:complete len:225 (+) Transcript_21283:81-755(+)
MADEKEQQPSEVQAPEAEVKDAKDAKAEPKAEAKAKAKAKAAANKSPEAIERDERLESNFKKYEHLTEEELKEMLPKKADGGFTSIGAMLHESGLCATCIFHHSPKGCYNAIKCRFCHHDHTKPSRAKSRKKKKPEGEGETPEEGGKLKKTKAREGGGESDAKRRRNGMPAPGTPELDEIGNSKPCWIAPGEESYPYAISRPPPAWGGVDPFAWRPPSRDPYYP